ncbi:hypothetical protein J8281_17465 [Aquimarina sp. U1-2]|uniref:hypothetical protein n=1 Tax=Aquimarina sp. U1-2 TaxID=2823141 RepID=UPI001AECFD0B|nr:hypothetical protein [Aquimarina sp. U1-2]MBP2833988.1 hypothetical protein [Aquimarina sp. U1-2]
MRTLIILLFLGLVFNSCESEPIKEEIGIEVDDHQAEDDDGMVILPPGQGDVKSK